MLKSTSPWLRRFGFRVSASYLHEACCPHRSPDQPSDESKSRQVRRGDCTWVGHAHVAALPRIWELRSAVTNAIFDHGIMIKGKAPRISCQYSPEMEKTYANLGLFKDGLTKLIDDNIILDTEVSVEWSKPFACGYIMDNKLTVLGEFQDGDWNWFVDKSANIQGLDCTCDEIIATGRAVRASRRNRRK